MANRKKPIAERLAEGGFYRPSRHGPKPERGLSLPVGEASPPDGLTGAASAEWTRLYGMLSRAGILTAAEQATFFNYCMWWGVLHDANQKVNALGLFPMKADGSAESEHVSKWLRLASEASGHMLKAAKELGLTPASRGLVTPVNVEPKASAAKSRGKGSLGILPGPFKLSDDAG